MIATLLRTGDCEQFLESETDLRLTRTRIALLLGVVLMPSGAALDWLIYPESIAWLSTVRFATTAVLAVGLVIAWYVPLGRTVNPLSVALIVLPSLALASMMYLTDGGQSTYYFGLILLMIIVHLLGFSLGESIVYCAITILAYMVAVFAHPHAATRETSQLVQGMFFLFTSALVCIMVCHVNRSNRRTAFLLQSQLREERVQLEESLRQLRETKQKLFQSEKMRAIAGLAAGLLHEINNPVNFSLMATKVLQKQIEPTDPAAETLHDIRDGVQRISRIVSDLRSFAHPEQEQSRTAFRLIDAVQMAERFAKNDLGDAELKIFDNDAMRCTVLGSESQVVQIFLNLLLNAHCANERSTNDSRIEVSALEVDNRVHVTITDTGIGMSEQQIAQSREPFYSTSDGKGLGLGLSICESIVASHGGDLVIESQPGVGTKITFDLPVRSVADSGEIANPINDFDTRVV